MPSPNPETAIFMVQRTSLIGTARWMPTHTLTTSIAYLSRVLREISMDSRLADLSSFRVSTTARTRHMFSERLNFCAKNTRTHKLEQSLQTPFAKEISQPNLAVKLELTPWDARSLVVPYTILSAPAQSLQVR